LGRLVTGGWVLLHERSHAKSFYKQLEPVPLGIYKTIADQVEVHSSCGVESPVLTGRLPSGVNIEILEVKYLHKGKRLRGRLRDGGWISILTTEEVSQVSGEYLRWAAPRVRVEAYEGAAGRVGAAAAAALRADEARLVLVSGPGGVEAVPVLSVGVGEAGSPSRGSDQQSESNTRTFG